MIGSSQVSARETQDQFLQLLTAQLRHQDPLEPVKQEAFLQQLAQFATLEGVEKLNARFEDMLRLQELTQGASLVGKHVRFHQETGSPGLGRVEQVFVDGDALQVVVNGQRIPINQIEALIADPLGA
jgi:flagellar basal-body rod modification protein FlgD